jgi:hypothetical protein
VGHDLRAIGTVLFETAQLRKSKSITAAAHATAWPGMLDADATAGEAQAATKTEHQQLRKDAVGSAQDASAAQVATATASHDWDDTLHARDERLRLMLLLYAATRASSTTISSRELISAEA